MGVKYFSKKFEKRMRLMKDMGLAAHILGIRIYRDRLNKHIGLCQDSYIDKVLYKFKMHDSKKGFLPMFHDITLSKTQCPCTHDEQEHMSRNTCALSIKSRYHSDPGEIHWT